MRISPWLYLAPLSVLAVGCGDADSLGLEKTGNASTGDPSGGSEAGGASDGTAGSAAGGHDGTAGGSAGVPGGGASMGGTGSGGEGQGGSAQGGSAGHPAGGLSGIGGGTYEPCAGKACGDNCSICPPNDPACSETAVIKYCHADGTCMGTTPQCGAVHCTSHGDCPAPAVACRLCDDGGESCPTAQCVEGQCHVSFPSCGDGGTRCLVEGKSYPSGTSGVPDPVSCNTCTCHDGQLTACTEAHCPEPCPEGTEYGSTCSQCGPAGGCTEVMSGCLATCTSDKDCGGSTPLCLDGVCGGPFCI